jgi:hypothetical protein
MFEGLGLSWRDPAFLLRIDNGSNKYQNQDLKSKKIMVPSFV